MTDVCLVALILNMVFLYMEEISSTCIFILVPFLASSALSTNVTRDSTISCAKSRQILRNQNGTITDGAGNYTQDTECEWLIESSPELPYINLRLTSLTTECSYDYVFVFDGPNSTSRLIGSFSGQNIPPPIHATSGFMYIRFFSDTNYALQGFSAEYSLTECPQNCSGGGICRSGVCECYHLYGGLDCSMQLCPDNCGETADRGRCEVRDGQTGCICNPGFVGDDCSLDDQNYVGNTWSLVSRAGPSRLSPRTRHAAVYNEDSDKLYVYGGFNLNNVLGDLMIYSFKENIWKNTDDKKDKGTRWSVQQSQTESALPPPSSPTFTTSQHQAHPDLDADSSKEISTSSARGDSPIPSDDDVYDGGFNQTSDELYSDESSLDSATENLDEENKAQTLDESQTDERTETTTSVFRGNVSDARDSKLVDREKRSPLLEESSREELPTPRSTWRVGAPPPLEGHAMSGAPGGFFLFGGRLENGSLSNQLWRFSYKGEKWMLIEAGSPPPPTWQHCMITVGQFIYVHGGSTGRPEFSGKLFRISTTDSQVWEEVELRGGKVEDIRLAGHTCIHYPRTNSILVYGGLHTDLPRFSKLSNKLFIFDVKAEVWSQIHFPREERAGSWIPPPLAFHSATLVANYMVLFGGYTHRHNSDEKCYSEGLYFYSLDCHTWISHEAMEHKPPGAGYPFRYGLFGSSMVTRNTSHIIIVAGYHGVPSGDVISFTLPSTLSTPDTPCHMYGKYNACSANPKCGWCGTSGRCMRFSETFSCTGNLIVTGCRGICSSLHTCQDCTTQGRGKCGWCVHSGKCFSKNGLYKCQGTFTQSTSKPWWAEERQELDTPQQCVKADIRPGLTLSRYDFPPDLTRPDGVMIVNSSSVKFGTKKLSGIMEHKLASTSQLLYTLQGTIHPVRNPNVRLEQLKLCIGQAGVSFSMFSSPGMEDYRGIVNVSHPLEVGSSYSSICQHVFWPETPLKPIFLYLNYAYHFRLYGWRNVSNPKTSLMKLEENGSVYGLESLQPYKGGSCISRTSCMACLEDSDCAWCDSTSSCSFRVNSTCSKHILEPVMCLMCLDHISCGECTQDTQCDWIAEDSRCVRSGRFKNSISTPDLCPAACESRTNCSSCLVDADCVWCRDKQECFPFSIYTSKYQYGGCQSWSDSVNGFSDHQCYTCDMFANCSTCLENVGCGWCYNPENPLEGVCTPGTFLQPAGGSCPYLQSNISTSTLETSNFTLETSTSTWAYEQCPDINECTLGIHKCHPRATCSNLPGSYTCQCNKGYLGNGFNECKRSCLETCVHGTCSGEPNYECNCEIGWTGADCSIDCGCNFHSTCWKGPGLCDQCLHFTTGPSCERCENGTYGDARGSEGCAPCFCNGHENTDQGICDPDTGACFCQYKFTGKRCELCSDGYFGEAAAGGDCRFDCAAKLVISNETKGLLGAVKHKGMERDCLWVITSNPEFSVENSNTTSNPPHLGEFKPVNLIFTGDKMDVSCEDNFVYVYDGLPPSLTSTGMSKQIAVVCSQYLDGETALTAESGIISILYSEKEGSSGFNASFSVLDCPCNPSVFTGIPVRGCECEDDQNTDLEDICPNNCNQDGGQGSCDVAQRRCICSEGYWGRSCSNRVEPNQIVSTVINLEDNPDLLARLGHSVTSDSNGIAWIFGGYHPDRGLLQDLRAFDLNSEQLKIVNFPSLSKPNGAPDIPGQRFFHAACYVPVHHQLYVHGGMNYQSQLNDVWRFDLGSLHWTQLAVKHQDMDLFLAGHTLTYIPESNSIILIGGYTQHSGVNGAVYVYSVDRDLWETFHTSGYPPLGLYGHSATFFPDTRSIYVFGGVTVGAGGSEIQQNLYALHLPSRTWSLLPFQPARSKAVYSNTNSVERRMFHSTVMLDQSIVFLGGSSTDTKISTISVYWPECLQWLKITAEHQNFQYMRPQSEWIGENFMSNYGGRSVVSSTGNIYTIGGAKEQFRKYISKIRMTKDVCNIFSKNTADCHDMQGCDFCSIGNSSLCFSNSGRFPGNGSGLCDPFSTKFGRKCDRSGIQQSGAACRTFTTCGECLAELPTMDNDQIRSRCQWCHGCDRGGKCVPLGSNCGMENLCYSHQTAIEYSGKCPELQCSSKSCSQCTKSKCFWSNQFTRSGKQRLRVGSDGIGWSCERTSLLDILQKVNKTKFVMEESSPPLPCPLPCHVYKACSTCLGGGGAEAGELGCLWSTSLNRCFSPTIQRMICLGGVCGKVIRPSDTCPIPCEELTTCSSCLQFSRCGWCSNDASSLTGDGVCVQGTVESPTSDSCQQLIDLKKVENVSLASPRSSWHFAKCPRENECNNGHHTCIKDSEVCVDTDQSYRCECSTGYVRVAGECTPVCEDACVYGTCVKPGTCKCRFGYVGDLCDVECNCFGNSDCKGPDELDVCLECQNNTTGDNCEYCLPGFVGNPMKKEKCTPCSEYCSGHTEYCFSKEFIDLLDKSNQTSEFGITIKDGRAIYTYDKSKSGQVSRLSKIGSSGDAICIDCKNNTRGEFCADCLEGYFRKAGSLRSACEPCFCNSHGDQCNPLTGGDCNCMNHTTSEPNVCTRKGGSVDDCWQEQCGKCKEFYIGDPRNGHQCFRSMSVDHDYCLEAEELTETCSGSPKPLRPGETVLYAVQPKFRNVNIRIVIDVTQGSLDVYTSVQSELFLINYNHTTGYKDVEFDTKYEINTERRIVSKPWRKPKEKYYSRFSGYMPMQYAEKPRRNHPILASNITISTQKSFSLRKIEGTELKTFEKLNGAQEILVVKNLKHRLVISLQEDIHDLRASKFFILLQASTTENSEPTYGNIFFRQDQLHIDLFVFFSVFFSCFFLFLSVCVIFWKVKQLFNNRRAQQQQVIEMRMMARRPFAKQDLILEAEDSSAFQRYDPTTMLQREKVRKVRRWNPGIQPVISGREEIDPDSSRSLLPLERYGIQAVSIEPTADGQAAVTTLLLQFPGNHIKLGVGCVLTNKVFASKNLKNY